MDISPFGTTVSFLKENASIKLDQITFAGKPLIFDNEISIVSVPEGNHVLSFMFNGKVHAEIIQVKGDELYLTIGQFGIMRD